MYTYVHILKVYVYVYVYVYLLSVTFSADIFKYNSSLLSFFKLLLSFGRICKQLKWSITFVYKKYLIIHGHIYIITSSQLQVATFSLFCVGFFMAAENIIFLVLWVYSLRRIYMQKWIHIYILTAKH